jgi:hypothetical protein
MHKKGRAKSDSAFALSQLDLDFLFGLPSVCGKHDITCLNYRIHLFTFGKA